ncbi:unnamed protein product [Caretta caretta]
MSWVRQAPGKGLEWGSRIYNPANSHCMFYSDAVKGRFTISRDDSSSLVYLQMTSLKAEDTTRYHAALEGARSQVVLTQSGPALKKPGESQKLQCATSGFTLSSYWMGWIRQEPGQGLEWLAWYYNEGNKYYASSVQGRFTASKDSTNFYLQMTGLRAEDTAVYHCARHTARGSESELGQKPPPAVTARRVRC